ncbi:hypothetical protein AB3S75_028147 [Citrus x aurantiifolia]
MPLLMGNRRVAKWIGWTPPTWPWCKLNTNGTRKQSGVASVGGLLRDQSGRWIIGFGMNIGMCLVTMAELWGLYQGQYMAWQQGCRWISVEVDSLCVTQLVSNPVAHTYEYAPLLQAIKDLIKQDWHIVVRHVYRKANHAADFLANYALSTPLGFHIFHKPPPGLASIITHDTYGIAYPYLILS